MAVQAPIFFLITKGTGCWKALNDFVNGVERVLNELRLKPVHKCQILGPGPRLERRERLTNRKNRKKRVLERP